VGYALSPASVEPAGWEANTAAVAPTARSGGRWPCRSCISSACGNAASRQRTASACPCRTTACRVSRASPRPPRGWLADKGGSVSRRRILRTWLAALCSAVSPSASERRASAPLANLREAPRDGVRGVTRGEGALEAAGRGRSTRTSSSGVNMGTRRHVATGGRSTRPPHVQKPKGLQLAGVRSSMQWCGSPSARAAIDQCTCTAAACTQPRGVANPHRNPKGATHHGAAGAARTRCAPRARRGAAA
jgi:hypothetical protein